MTNLIETYPAIVPWIVILPLLGFLVNGVAGLFFKPYRSLHRFIGTLATLAVFFPFLLTILLLWLMPSQAGPFTHTFFTWIETAGFSVDIAYRIDSLSLLMTLVVTGIGSLIHLYSMGYMSGDEGYWKFFSFLNLFIFAMLNLVLADNLLLLFLGWEGVGLCSYLLIGYWYDDMKKSDAGKKAFLYNRVGDFAFLIALFMIFHLVGSLRFEDILAQTHLFDAHQIFIIGLLVLIGATGKSAQIPLFVWLPDAMAGPTPVSALIHAATMVTAGVYLIARLSPFFILSPELLLVIAVIGALTAFVAATIALTQYDIKAILAYSTISQLGFMFLALGSGAFIAAIFHVVTHAFFKACLFLGAGSVIHAMQHLQTPNHHNKKLNFDAQDIRLMGGLRHHLPSTYKTFLIATIAIAGIPPLAGFFSKDEILMMTFNAGAGPYGTIYFILWGVALLTAFLTAFYMFRLTFSTFHGAFRLPRIFPAAKGTESLLHESPFSMTSVLWALGLLSVVGGLIGFPDFVVATFTGTAEVNLLSRWLSGVTENTPLILGKLIEWILLILSVGVASAGVFFAYRLYGTGELTVSDQRIAQKSRPVYDIWTRKYSIDKGYEKVIIQPTVRFSDKVLSVFDVKVIDGIVNIIASLVRFAGSILRFFQDGFIRTYAFAIVIGTLITLLLLLF